MGTIFEISNVSNNSITVLCQRMSKFCSPFYYAQCTLRYLWIRSVSLLSTFWGYAELKCTYFPKYLSKTILHITASLLADVVSLSAVDIFLILCKGPCFFLLASLLLLLSSVRSLPFLLVFYILNAAAISVGWWPLCSWRIPYLNPCCCKLFWNFTDQSEAN